MASGPSGDKAAKKKITLLTLCEGPPNLTLNKPIKFKVLHVSTEKKYKPNNTNSDDLTYYRYGYICDNTKLMKLGLYGRKHLENICKGSTVFAVNVVVSSEKNSRDRKITIKDNSEVFSTANMEIDQKYLEEIQHLVSPAEPAKVDICTALSSPRKGKYADRESMTVEGHIRQNNQVRDVTIHNEIAAVKDIQVEDPSGVITVTLWREAAEMDTSTGKHVKITHLVPTFSDYLNTNTLASTTFTSVIETAPAEEPVSDYVLVIAINDGCVLDEDGGTYAIPENLQNALNIDQQQLPKEAAIKLVNHVVTEFTWKK